MEIHSTDIQSQQKEKLTNRTPSAFSDEGKLRAIVSQSYSYREVIRKFDLGRNKNSTDRLKMYIKLYNIDTSHFSVKNRILNQGTNKIYSNEEIFIENSPHTTLVRGRILRDKLLPYVCECGNDGIWHGQELTLQLDHINGI
ncbi:MAG TPA: hypothetical protein VM577_19155, partial [Anaerovoracaceae bacterium]|nr:hypothetical protein [Anaerovoracaceae bacterium]